VILYKMEQGCKWRQMRQRWQSRWDPFGERQQCKSVEHTAQVREVSSEFEAVQGELLFTSTLGIDEYGELPRRLDRERAAQFPALPERMCPDERPRLGPVVWTGVASEPGPTLLKSSPRSVPLNECRLFGLAAFAFPIRACAAAPTSRRARLLP
jgi:hypothetical protein